MTRKKNRKHLSKVSRSSLEKALHHDLHERSLSYINRSHTKVDEDTSTTVLNHGCETHSVEARANRHAANVDTTLADAECSHSSKHLLQIQVKTGVGDQDVCERIFHEDCDTAMECIELDSIVPAEQESVPHVDTPVETFSLQNQAPFEILPTDILFAVFDCLLNPLITFKYAVRPQNRLELNQLFEYNCAPFILDSIASEHPFLRLALVSHTVRDKIETYCAHANQRILGSIVQRPKKRLRNRSIGQKNLTERITRLKSRQKKACSLVKEEKPHRINWINLAWTRCMFCGKSTFRRAIFHYMIWCCRDCDDEIWPKQKRDDVLGPANPQLMPIHLDNPRLVHRRLKALTPSYDWPTKNQFYLVEEVEKFVDMLRKYDPNLEKSRRAEREETQRVNDSLLLPPPLRWMLIWGKK